MKLKDGLPRKAFAYAPDADPSTWKLPIYTSSGTVDEGRLPGAAAALSEGGFRGEKADIPAAALANVKARLRSAYRKWKGSDAEYPDSIKEAEVMLRESAAGPALYTIREATVLLDKSAVCATVIAAPNGDMLVVPGYDGQFQYLAKPYESPAESPYDASWDVSDMAGVLATVTRIRAREMDDPAQLAMIDRIITGAADFMRSEATEVTESRLNEAVAVIVEEAGRRNSASDQKVLNAAHDALHDAGAAHDPAKKYKGMPDMPMAEAAIEVDAKAKSKLIDFSEASAEEGSTALVLLSEADAVWNDAARTVTITPIKPGFGNKRDGFYYPAKTLREATEGGMFDHLKMYRNHPRKSDEKDLPERDVNDWFATTREAHWDDATESPRVEVKVHSDVDYGKWKDAPEQIAFSVRGGGYARPGRADGQETKIVEALAKVRSVDWVTEAGAGGAITFAESAADEEFEMKLGEFTIDQLKEELRIREAAEGAVADPEAKPKAEAESPTPPNPTPEPAPEPVKAEAKAEVIVPDGYVPAASIDEAVAKALKERDDAAAAKAEVQESAKKAVAEEIAKSTLTRPVKDAIAAEFREAGYGSAFIYADEPALRTAVQGRLANATRLLVAAGKAPSPVKGLGAEADPEEHEATISEAVATGLAARWGEDKLPEHGKGVFTAEELANTGGIAATPPPAEPTPEAANLSEAAAKVQSSLAAGW